jgi:hypothetical protein
MAKLDIFFFSQFNEFEGILQENIEISLKIRFLKMMPETCSLRMPLDSPDHIFIIRGM